MTSAERLVRTLGNDAGSLTDEQVAEAYVLLARELASRGDGESPTDGMELVTGASLAERVKEMREKRARGVLEGLATGYGRLDKASGGWRDGELIVVGASSGVGKTNYVLNCLHNMALEGIASLFISLEMTNEQVYDRLVGLNTSPLVGLTEEQAQDLPVYYMGSDWTRPDLMHAFVRKFVVEHPTVRLICIDHLSLLPALNTERRLSHAAWAERLRNWVKEFNVPIVLIHHLRRGATDNQAPQLVDLAESQDIVNHADQIYLLQRDTESPVNRNYLHVVLKKNRNGGQLHRDVLHIDEHYKVSEMEPRTAARLIQEAKSVFNLDQ